MTDSIQEYLRRKGAIGLLSLLHERPMTYSEIEPEIEVTSSTITERRDEAAELGLLTVSLGEAEVGTKKVYHLTEMGEFLADQMAREGIVSNYRKMRTFQQLLEEQTGEIITWIEKNPSQLLQFDEAAEGTILSTGSVGKTNNRGSTTDGPMSNADVDNEPVSGEENDSEGSSPRVIRPPKETERKSENNDPSGEWETKSESDDNDDRQRRLSDPDVQERMQEAATDKTGEDEEDKNN